MTYNPPPTPSNFPLNGPLASTIGTVAALVAGGVIGWLSSKNIIPAADVTQDTALVTTAIMGVVGAAIVAFKAYQSRQDAMVKTLNADKTNGVKVVADTPMTSTIPAVSNTLPKVK